jgi:hypothetical protein
MEEFVLFPNWINHNCLSEGLERIKNRTHGAWKRESRSPISAGFVRFTENGPECHGMSESLKLQSRHEDTYLLRRQLA